MGKGHGKVVFFWDKPKTSFRKLFLKPSGCLLHQQWEVILSGHWAGPGQAGPDVKGKAE